MRALRLLVPAAVLLLAGCDRLTLANYNKIHTGMRYEEVTRILGEPAKCSEALGIRICNWGDEKHGANVNFVGGEVVLTSAENLR
jgi:hypothetical protein